jgi:hypothetical protein
MRKLLSVSAVPVLVVALLTTGFNSQNVKAEPAKVINQTSQNTTPTLLAQATYQKSQSFFTSKKWRFARADGSIIAKSIQLNRDGSITGYYHPNEDSWGLENGQVVFYNVDGNVSTHFNQLKKNFDGKWVLSGENAYRHMLIQL